MTALHAAYRTRHGLTDAARERLDVGHYAILGTSNEDGSTHVVPVMFHFEEGRIYLETSAATRKVRNVLARPHATALVQDHRADGTASVSRTGTAEVLYGDEAQRIARRIRARYYTELGEEHVESVLARHEDAVIAITP